MVRHQYVFRQSQIVTKKFSPLEKLEVKTEFGGKLFLSGGSALTVTVTYTQAGIQTNTAAPDRDDEVFLLDCVHSAS